MVVRDDYKHRDHDKEEEKQVHHHHRHHAFVSPVHRAHLTSTSSDSKCQTELPSSSIEFHHRRPTSSRPVTFFTVQKSAPTSRTVMMKRTTNEALKPPKT